MLRRHEALAGIDRLSSYTSLGEGAHAHLVRAPTAEVDERGGDAAALVGGVAEAEVEDWESAISNL